MSGGREDVRAAEVLADYRGLVDPTPPDQRPTRQDLPARLERLAGTLPPREACDLQEAVAELLRLREATSCSIAVGGVTGDGRVYGTQQSIRAAEQRMGGG